MDISIDFSEVGHPTGKQIDFVQDICKVLELEPPEYTFDDYSEFISEYKDEYYYSID